MREILFRGKPTLEEFGKGVRTNFPIKDEDDNFVKGMTAFLAAMTQSNSKKIFVIGHLLKRDNKVYIADDSTEIEAIPTTVGQFTGSVDKNGQRIFEGDIIEISNGSVNGKLYIFKRIVEYSNNLFTIPAFESNSDHSHWYQVIGNIHDDPKLMNDEVRIEY